MINANRRFTLNSFIVSVSSQSHWPPHLIAYTDKAIPHMGTASSLEIWWSRGPLSDNQPCCALALRRSITAWQMLWQKWSQSPRLHWYTMTTSWQSTCLKIQCTVDGPSMWNSSYICREQVALRQLKVLHVPTHLYFTDLMKRGCRRSLLARPILCQMVSLLRHICWAVGGGFGHIRHVWMTIWLAAACHVTHSGHIGPV